MNSPEIKTEVEEAESFSAEHLKRASVANRVKEEPGEAESAG